MIYHERNYKCHITTSPHGMGYILGACAGAYSVIINTGS
jgi:hypothetical protein